MPELIEHPGEFLAGQALPPYVQGFVTIETNRRLVVTATYTVAEKLGEGDDAVFVVKSIDVEHARRTINH